MAKGKGRTEGAITSGGIETSVEGFHGNITTSSPFSATYGDHKRPGSQMLPTSKGGRGGAKSVLRGKTSKASFK